MLEAQAHQHLKALLRQEGETRWPHHLTLSRLVARSLRRGGLLLVDTFLDQGRLPQLPHRQRRREHRHRRVSDMGEMRIVIVQRM